MSGLCRTSMERTSLRLWLNSALRPHSSSSHRRSEQDAAFRGWTDYTALAETQIHSPDNIHHCLSSSDIHDPGNHHKRRISEGVVPAGRQRRESHLLQRRVRDGTPVSRTHSSVTLSFSQKSAVAKHFVALSTNGVSAVLDTLSGKPHIKMCKLIVLLNHIL